MPCASPALPVVPGGFACVLADPPWRFDAYSGDGGTPHRTAEDHYPTMRLDDMMALPVADICAADAALFMWVVGSHIDQALRLAEAWGFTYKTDAFYWLKSRLFDAMQPDLFTGDVAPPRMGFGYWTRKQVEPCLLFTRGRPQRLSKGVRQAIVAPIRDHSRKPNEQYDRIEALVAGPRVELFSRTNRVGWHSWGRDVGKFGEAA